jgi:hypothetical protein
VQAEFVLREIVIENAQKQSGRPIGLQEVLFLDNVVQPTLPAIHEWKTTNPVKPDVCLPGFWMVKKTCINQQAPLAIARKGKPKQRRLNGEPRDGVITSPACSYSRLSGIQCAGCEEK